MRKPLEIPGEALHEIEAAPAKEKNAKVARWLLGIRLVALKHTTTQTAAELHVSDRGVRRWVRRFLDGGMEAMHPAPRPGRPSLPAPEDGERFKDRIRRGPVPQDGFATWRGPFVRDMLRREFGADYRGTGVYDLLHRMGFSSLMPRPQHPDADPEEQKRFQKKLCPGPFAAPPGATRNPKSNSGSRTRRASASKER